MEERRLRVYDGEKTFFSKISTTISKILIPTRLGINGMLINFKRNTLIKTYANYIDNINHEDVSKRDSLFNKYEEAYALYLEAIDKHIMDTVYKKVKINTATDIEKEALSNYYTVVSLKETEFVEYKYRKQKYLLELDFEGCVNNDKMKNIDTYKSVYIEKMEIVYKGIIKNYAVKLADNLNRHSEERDKIFEKIFDTIEEYMKNIFKLKIEQDENLINKELLEEYEKYEGLIIGKSDYRDVIEKRMIILGISRQIFTHSLPLVVAEQCYIKLLKDIRILIIRTMNKEKRNKVYELFINLVEAYNIRLLSTKVYWEKAKERENYKIFWDEYKKLASTQKEDELKFIREREILFLRNDIRLLNSSKKDFRNIIALHKNRLTEYGVMKKFKNKAITMQIKGPVISKKRG